jgi:hypothetical protein
MNRLSSVSKKSGAVQPIEGRRPHSSSLTSFLYWACSTGSALTSTLSGDTTRSR